MYNWAAVAFPLLASMTKRTLLHRDISEEISHLRHICSCKLINHFIVPGKKFVWNVKNDEVNNLVIFSVNHQSDIVNVLINGITVVGLHKRTDSPLYSVIYGKCHIPKVC